jgi:hypothetical protein
MSHFDLLLKEFKNLKFDCVYTFFERRAVKFEVKKSNIITSNKGDTFYLFMIINQVSS